MRLEFGKWMETIVDWLSTNFDFIFEALSNLIDFIVSSFQKALVGPPSWIIMILMVVIVHLVYAGTKESFKFSGLKKSWSMVVFSIVGSLLVMSFQMWDEMMYTMALVISAAFLALLVGMPLGILTAKSNRLEYLIRPIMDFMQTMPPFVYLIPAIIFFGVGNVPGVVATVVFALPPAVRFTSLGSKGVSGDYFT